jgi:hypothetical protein
VRHRGDHPPESGWAGIVWKEKIRNSCFLSIKRGNGSRHLICWLLKTLTGLRVWVKGLIV